MNTSANTLETPSNAQAGQVTQEALQAFAEALAQVEMPEVDESQEWYTEFILSDESEELLKHNAESGELSQAVRALVECAQSEPNIGLRWGTDPARNGRFQLPDAAASSARLLGLLRICRSALDFIEDDLNACIESDQNYHARNAQAFDIARQMHALSGNVAEIVRVKRIEGDEEVTPAASQYTHGNDQFTPPDFLSLLNETEVERDARLDAEYEQWREFYRHSFPKTTRYTVQSLKDENIEGRVLTNVPLKGTRWRALFSYYAETYHAENFDLRNTIVESDGTEFHTNPITRDVFMNWLTNTPFLMQYWVWVSARWDAKTRGDDLTERGNWTLS